MEPRNKYGLIIKQARVARGLKAAYVAAKIHVAPGTYSQIECCKRGLSAERLLDILKVFGMTLTDLEEMMNFAQRINKLA